MSGHLRQGSPIRDFGKKLAGAVTYRLFGTSKRPQSGGWPWCPFNAVLPTPPKRPTGGLLLIPSSKKPACVQGSAPGGTYSLDLRGKPKVRRSAVTLRRGRENGAKRKFRFLAQSRDERRTEFLHIVRSMRFPVRAWNPLAAHPRMRSAGSKAFDSVSIQRLLEADRA